MICGLMQYDFPSRPGHVQRVCVKKLCHLSPFEGHPTSWEGSEEVSRSCGDMSNPETKSIETKDVLSLSDGLTCLIERGLIDISSSRTSGGVLQYVDIY